MKVLLVLITFLLLYSLPHLQSSADGLWCGNALITEGTSRFEVLARCGEPDYKIARFEKRIKRDYYRDLFMAERWRWYREEELYREPYLAVEEVLIEEWTYNLGPTRFIRYLIFENGKLVDIKTGDYGF
jgi:hypothetical protein